MDKVQKIRKEVEMVVNRRLNLLNGDYFDLNKETYGFTNEIIDIIDSLQKEPVSNVWHNVKEKPQYKDSLIGRQIAVYGETLIGEAIAVCSMIDENTIYAPVSKKEYAWDTCPFTKWAYVTDLLILSNLERTAKNWKEEPVSIDFEQELYKAFGQVKDFTLGMRIAKRFYDMGKNSQEPVSEELEEAAKQYGDELDNVLVVSINDDNSIGEYATQAFKAGAEWQKAKDESITNDLGEYINKLSKQFPEVSFAKLSRIAVRVAQWQKEKMMANAIDGDITFDYYGDDDKTYGCIAHDSFCLEDLGLKDTDKVKMIIIKED